MDGANLGILAPEERLTFVEQTLNELIGSILRLPVDAIDTNHSLLNMGVDSLMAMELQAGIDRRLGLKVPTLELMKGVPVSALIRNVTAMISRPETTADTGMKDEPRPEPAPRRTDIGALLAQLDHMSPEEIERTIAVLEETGPGE